MEEGACGNFINSVFLRFDTSKQINRTILGHFGQPSFWIIWQLLTPLQACLYKRILNRIFYSFDIREPEETC